MQHFIALGGNLGKTEEYFEKALFRIGEVIGKVTTRSSWFTTAPLLHESAPTENQSDYLNGVAMVSSELSPPEVLESLLLIEIELGREREKEEKPWSPRVIDLDLIASEDRVISSEFLTLPHPEMHKRLFVLEPLSEFAGDWCHPILGKTVAEMIADCRAEL